MLQSFPKGLLFFKNENGTKNMGIRSQEEGKLLKNRSKNLRCYRMTHLNKSEERILGKNLLRSTPLIL